MKKTISILIIILGIAGMVALLVHNKMKLKNQETTGQSSEIVRVETSTIEETNFSPDCSSNAVLQADKDLNFVSDVSGRVTALFVDKGSRVKKGTLLLKIDSEMLEADYQSALASYEALKKDEGRFSNSSQAGGVSDQQLDNIRTQLAAAKSRMEISRRRLSDASVKSPMDGIINMRYVETGSLIAPNVPLFDIVNDSKLKVTCSLPVNKVNMIAKGQQVTATSNDAPGTTFTGRIENIGVKTDSGLNYPVDVIMDKNPRLKIGMYMNVNFSTGESRKGILIPRNTIVGSVKSACVYIEKNGIALKRDVVLGDMVGEQVEILSGLNVGDMLITSGIMNVSNGIKVKSID